MTALPLQALFKAEFDDSTRSRGEHCFARGWVHIVESGEEKVVALVSGREPRRVRLGWGPAGTMECECPEFEQEGPCQHLWATMLEADHLGIGPELDPDGGADAYQQALIDRIEAEEWANAGTNGGSASPGEDEDAEGWRARLADLRQRLAGDERNPWAGLDVRTWEIRYVLDIEASRSIGAPVLGTFQCRRRKNGEWGALREYATDVEGNEPPVDPLDRRIFAALRERGHPRFQRRAGALAGGRVRGAVENGFVLDRELCADFLPLLCQTRRLHWISRREAGGPLGWDPAGTWELELALQREDDESVLSAGLRRRIGATPASESAQTDSAPGTEQRMELEEPLALFGFGFVVTRTSIAAFDPRGAMAWVAELRTNGPLRVPLADEPALVESLLQLPSGAWSKLPGVFLAQTQPTPHLLVAAPAGAGGRPRANERLACRIAFDYGSAGQVAPEHPAEVLPVPAQAGASDTDGAADTAGAELNAKLRQVVHRDLAAEARALEQALGAGMQRTAQDEEQGIHGSVLAKNAAMLVRRLFAAQWVVEADGRVLRGARGVRASVRSGQDWFDLEGGLEFEGRVAPFPAILAAVREGRHTVLLDDGSAGLLPEAWLESWGLLELAKRADGDALRFGREQGWLLDALLADRVDVESDAGFERYRERIATFSGITAEREPESFQGELRSYQRDGLGWFTFLRDLGLGGCLADDMGLGKTIQVLALLEERRRLRASGELPSEPRASLVVAPRSLVFNWMDEAKRFTPELAVVDYTGPERKLRMAENPAADLFLTTYGTLLRDVSELSEREFDYLVLDEAQAIKNAASQSAKAARKLNGKHRLALSGTPVENHLGELWSLFEFLNPGMLGRSSAFQRFVQAERTVRTQLGGRSLVARDSSEVEGLGRALRPFFLRRKKEEVLSDLPKKTEQTLYCEFSDEERQAYEELAAYYRSALLTSADELGERGLGRIKIQVLEALLRLRQSACHRGLLDEQLRGEDSAKLSTLLPLLEEIAEEGHKALVFSQFTSLLSIVRDRLDQRGLVYEYLDGSTRDRKERVDRFQGDPKCPLFLISLKAGGQGLNLTAADYVFLLDPWWNPAVEAQAIDRAHRIGRTKPVFAYRLIARGTVEEKVLELQANKRELAEALFRESETVLRDLTREDLEALLS